MKRTTENCSHRNAAQRAAKMALVTVLLTSCVTLIVTAIGDASSGSANLESRSIPYSASSLLARATGLTFNFTVISSSDKRQRENGNINALVQMQDGNVRMDYSGGTSPMGMKGVDLRVA